MSTVARRLPPTPHARYQPHLAAAPHAPLPAAHIPQGTLLTEEVLRALINDAVREELARRDER